MTLAARFRKAVALKLVPCMDDKDYAKAIRIYTRMCCDSSEDEDLLQGLAIAEVFTDTSFPGWIPIVQELGCKIADIPDERGT